MANVPTTASHFLTPPIQSNPNQTNSNSIEMNRKNDEPNKNSNHNKALKQYAELRTSEGKIWLEWQKVQRWNLGPVPLTHIHTIVQSTSFIIWLQQHSFTLFIFLFFSYFVQTLLFIAQIRRCPFILIIFIGRVNDRLVSLFSAYNNQTANLTHQHPALACGVCNAVLCVHTYVQLQSSEKVCQVNIQITIDSLWHWFESTNLIAFHIDTFAALHSHIQFINHHKEWNIIRFGFEFLYALKWIEWN